MSITKKVSLFEVGPRDGLQNEKKALPLQEKLKFIQNLVAAGVRDLEVGAFVREDKIPQMANTAELFLALETSLQRGCRPYALVANEKGLDRAIQSGVKNIAVFTAATDGFNQKNIGRTVDESLREYRPLIQRAAKNGIKVRGYVSTVFGCPYEGKVKESHALKVISKLADLGVEQVSIGDTIGVARPSVVRRIMRAAVKDLGKKKVAGHFHDTRGTALAHVWISFEEGVCTFDSSAGGLGGCPYAPGATGNVATEDLIALFHSEGISTGLDLDKIAVAAQLILKAIGREPQSRVLRAFIAEKLTGERTAIQKFFRYGVGV